MKKAYYGRCMSIYGTKQEERDINIINRLGYEVIPFPPQSELNARKDKGENVMETVFKPLVRSSEVMFFRGIANGKISAGVAQELAWAADIEIPLLELPGRIISRAISVEKTREYLREVGQR